MSLVSALKSPTAAKPKRSLTRDVVVSPHPRIKSGAGSNALASRERRILGRGHPPFNSAACAIERPLTLREEGNGLRSVRHPLRASPLGFFEEVGDFG